MRASVVARKRPLGQGYGLSAQPMGSVRPATTRPANQTAQGPSRVVASATTGWASGQNMWLAFSIKSSCLDTELSGTYT